MIIFVDWDHILNDESTLETTKGGVFPSELTKIIIIVKIVFIGPESDNWLCLSLTHSLTHWLTDCRLVNLIDVTLVCEDGISKLVEVITVVDVDDEDRVVADLDA